MKIEITSYVSSDSNSNEIRIYRADCKDLPGTPPCGCGLNKYEAIGSLLNILSKERVSDGLTWTEKYLNFKLELDEKC
jgi:hypothetical protein